MPTPPRPDWITAAINSMLSPEEAPVAAPNRCAAGQLGPSSMLVPCLSKPTTEQRRSILARQYPVLSLSLRPPIDRSENCDAEE